MTTTYEKLVGKVEGDKRPVDVVFCDNYDTERGICGLTDEVIEGGLWCVVTGYNNNNVGRDRGNRRFYNAPKAFSCPSSRYDGRLGVEILADHVVRNRIRRGLTNSNLTEKQVEIAVNAIVGE